MSGRGRGQILKEVLASRKAASESSADSSGRSNLVARLRQQRLSPTLDSQGLSRPSDDSSSSIATRKSHGPPSEKVVKEGILSLPVLEPISYEGTEGRPVRIVPNYVGFDKTSEDVGIYEYLVNFSPPLDEIKERSNCVLQHQEVFGEHKSFDGGHKLFLPILLADQYLQSVTKSGTKVNVAVNFVAKRPYSDPVATALLNRIFQRVTKELNLTKMNRGMFDPKAGTLIPHLKLEVWPGFITTINEYKGGLMMICDSSSRVLRTDTVRDQMQQLFQSQPSDFRAACLKTFLGTIVLTRYSNKSYRIDDIEFDKTPRDSFLLSNGEELTYQAYYKRQYDLEIKDLGQPLLLSRAKVRSTTEKGLERTLYLVPEFCCMTGLSEKMRNDFKVMREVATLTRHSPMQRHSAITKFVRNVKQNETAMKILHGWGLIIKDRPNPLNGRVLNPPMLHFNKASKGTAEGGDWNRSLGLKPLLTAVNIEKWVLIYTDKCRLAADKFNKTFQQTGERMGMQVKPPLLKKVENEKVDTYLLELRSCISTNISLVVAIFPQQRSDRYAGLKKLCCVEFPVPSQVVIAKTLENERRLASVVQKIAMQINVKLGGELWGSLSHYQGMMIVGIDVYHDPSKRNPSVSAVVASMNDTNSKWFSKAHLQEQSVELVDNLRQAFIDILQAYYNANHAWPKSVMIFRDGIGDSQLETSLKIEVEEMFNTFHKVTEGNKKFGFVVVQKRINTKLLLESGENNLDNPPPGTIVDHSITKLGKRDFYLVSQKVNHGTVAPTHYVVMDCEGAGTPPKAETVQKVAYQQSHMYYNWPGTVRVPAPCLYAHKLAAMVGEHTKKPHSKLLNGRLFYI